jgi:drug/metabolite transporter (DMT)-like permease
MAEIYRCRPPNSCQTPGVLLGLVAGLLAAALFGVVAVVQAAVIRRHGLFTPRMLLVIAIYLVGWLLHLVAIAQLPLYLAQVTVGASLVVAALVAAFVMGEPLHPQHWAAIVAMAVGLGLLALASGSVGTSHFTTTTTVVLYAALVVNAVLGWTTWRWGSEWSGVALGVLAGTAYAGSPVATRSLVDPSLDPATIAPALTIGLFGGLGFLLYSAAMKRGSVTAATSPVVLLPTIVPAIVGLTTFGDEVRTGWWLPAVLAFVISVAAGVVLCSAEAELELLAEVGDQPS